MMNDVLNVIEKNRVVPLVSFNDLDKVVPTVEALRNGGFSLVEITFRTELGAQAIDIASRNFQDMTIIAGTVLSVDNVDKAIECGADVLVAPGFNPNIVEYALRKNVCFIPGVMTPSDIEMALGYGLNHLKFFPAQASGGVNMLDAFYGPYQDVKFMPTGGINDKNIMDYLKRKNVIACGGSWIANSKNIENNDFKMIEEISRELLTRVSNNKT